MQIKWTPTAAQHLQAIQDCIAQDNPAAAHRVAQTIKQRVEKLTHHPYSGRPGRVEGTRELILSGSPYTVVYAVSGNQLVVLAVFHQARKWLETLEE